MRYRKFAVAFAAMAALGLSSPAQAQSGNGGERFDKGRRGGEHRAAPRGFEDQVDRRQTKQRARIRDGRRNGELTRRESGRLKQEQRQVNRLDRRFGSDGRYSPRERRVLEKKQDRASRHIGRAKHNDRTRYGDRDDRRGNDKRAGGNGYGRHERRGNRDQGWTRADHRGRGPENGDRYGRDNGHHRYAKGRR
jgi:hypothetical protein